MTFLRVLAAHWIELWRRELRRQMDSRRYGYRMSDVGQSPRQVKLLAVSDQVDPRIHSGSLRQRMPDIDIVFGCGDVPARYLEFLADALDRPVYFVLGNHHEELTRKGIYGKRYDPMGCIDVGGKIHRDAHTGLLIGGFPGSPKYSRETDQQYSNTEVRWMMFKMIPALLWNRVRYGRFIDVLISHAPPRDINDRDDIPHRGFPSLRSFLRWFRPVVHLHGHIHIYDRNEAVETTYHDSTVINVYPFTQVELAVHRHARADRIISSGNHHG
jgi:uncharacterized protein